MAARVVTGIEAVVFDLFGTLVFEFPRGDWDAWLETSAAIVDADADAFRAGWEATTIERQTGRLGDIEECLRTVAARAGAWPTDAQIAEALEERAAMYRTWFVPRPGAEEVLVRLRSDGYPLALVSMCTPDTPAMWRTSPLDGTVDVEIFSSEVALRKPDPAIYLLAAERLAVAPAACLYVGDGSYHELSGAAAVGMHPVLIRDPQEEAEMLRPEVDEWGRRLDRRPSPHPGSAGRLEGAHPASGVERDLSFVGRETSERRPHGGPHGDAASPEDLLQGGVDGERAEERPEPGHVLARRRVSIVHERRHDLGERRREARDRAACLVLKGLEHERLRTDEQVEALEHVGFDGAPRRVRDLHAGEVRRRLPQAFDHGHRDRVPRPPGELVDVERERAAGLGCRAQMREQRRSVEGEVRRRDHRDGIGADLLGVRGERDAVGRALSAGVDRNLEPIGASLEEPFGHAPAFVDREQDALAGGATGQHAVDAVVGEEAGERADRALVELAPVSRERRHRRGDRPAEHGVMLAGRGSGRRRKGYITKMRERTDEVEEEDDPFRDP